MSDRAQVLWDYMQTLGGAAVFIELFESHPELWLSVPLSSRAALPWNTKHQRGCAGSRVRRCAASIHSAYGGGYRVDLNDAQGLRAPPCKGFATIDEAKAWADEQLPRLGWVLL